MTDPRDEAAARFHAIATELDAAARHCRTTAGHFRERQVPRAAAHAFAAFGHLGRAHAALAREAATFADHSSPEPEDRQSVHDSPAG